MKGIIFCLLEKMVVSQCCPGAWDNLVRQTPLLTVGGFIGPETYPDEDLSALVRTASELTGRSVSDLFRAFGRFSFRGLARAYPDCLPPGISAKRFLMSVDRMMHIEVDKLRPAANRGYFSYEDPGPDQLVMNYQSPRQLCDFAAGLIDGVGDVLGEEIVQVKTQCMRLGDPRCRFELRFVARAGRFA